MGVGEKKKKKHVGKEFPHVVTLDRTWRVNLTGTSYEEKRGKEEIKWRRL